MTNKETEILEKGIMIGSKIAELENNGIITFTSDFSYDDEFLKLGEKLIQEFNNKENLKYHYFSEFLEQRLKEIEKL